MKRIVRNFDDFIKEDVNIVEPDVDVNSEDSVKLGVDGVEVEEEGDVYIGVKMMNELADKLGVEYSGSGPIVYDDVEINFFSETEKYHIGSKKFGTSDEVVDFLTK